MSDQKHDIIDASPISKPLIYCPACHSTELEAIVEAVVQDVHFLCNGCGRCWDVALGSVTRVAPTSCLGCPKRGRCEQVYAADHEGQPIG